MLNGDGSIYDSSLMAHVIHEINQVNARNDRMASLGLARLLEPEPKPQFFDQNRRKPKPQFFVVRDTVFTRFLVSRLYGQARCPCVPYVGQITYYRSSVTLSYIHSLTAYCSRFYVVSCTLPRYRRGDVNACRLWPLSRCHS